MKIITLTLNPAIDMHCYAENFEPFHENLAHITSSDAGGKGVNISRALTVNGVENLARVVLGNENGKSFADSLKADGMDLIELYVDGRIRENITLHTNNNPETRISFAGFVATDALIDAHATLADRGASHTALAEAERNSAAADVQVQHTRNQGDAGVHRRASPVIISMRF